MSATGKAQSRSCLSARQIADLLKVSPQAIRQRLAKSPRHQTQLIRGNETKVWPFDALPFQLQAEIKSAAEVAGLRDPGQPIETDGNTFHLPDLAECHADDIDQAMKLRAAMERALACRNSSLISGGELAVMGLADYTKAFGHTITERHWRRLFNRVLQRAGATEDFTRLEWFLPERPRLKTGPVASAINEEDPDLAAIRSRVTTFDEPLNPTASEREWIWTNAVEWFEEQCAGGRRERAVKEELVSFLVSVAPSLARSRDSLRKGLDRRLRNPNALQDRRAAANAKRAKVVDLEEMAEIIYTANRKYRGRLAPAVREVRGGNAGSNKSYVPETIRRIATPMIAALAPFQQGPRAADKASPPMDLSYDGIRPMDCLVMDDATWNVYLRWQNPDGSWKLTRGQIILIIDFRTLAVLHFGIIPEEQPNSLLAYSVATKAMERFGVPKVLYLERGKVFAESKLMTGGKNTLKASRLPGWNDIPLAERELGLQRLGIRFVVARRARSKAVELVIGKLQDLTDGEVGYCGRNERFDRPEGLTRLLKEASSLDPDVSANALAQFYTIDEWADRFEQHVTAYNATPQQGKHLNGLSPADAFDQWFPVGEVSELDASLRHWLSCHRKPIDVVGGAVSFRLRGETFSYRSELLSSMEGRKVLVWFDPELPEAVTVTDMKHRNPVNIDRDEKPNALEFLFDETCPVLTRETAKVQRHQRYWSGVHRTLQLKFEHKFRRNIVSAREQRLGEFITDQKSRATTRRRNGLTDDRRRRQLAAHVGCRPEELPSDAIRSDDEFNEGLRELRRESQQSKN